MPPDTPWAALEWIKGLNALPEGWTRFVGVKFETFKRLCLESGTIVSTTVPCPRQCGCDHRIVIRHDKSSAIGACICAPPTCPDIPLTMTEITPWHLDWTKLAHSLCTALDLTPRLTNLNLQNTQQIGSWSAAAVPVILAIHHERTAFQAAVGHLTTTQPKPFILLAPTASNLDAVTSALLHQARAIFFGLDSIVALADHGKLKTLKTPTELFSQLAQSSHYSITPLPQSPGTPSPHSAGPRYSLRKSVGIWHLIFGREEYFIRHERGLFYVHWLLYHPDECPIHAIDLMAKIPEIYRQQLGLPALTDPVTGKTVALESAARLQERNLTLDDRESMRALCKKQTELEALLESDHASGPEKAEATTELEQIYDFLRQHLHRTKSSAQKTSHAVREAIRHLLITLRKSKQTHEHPNSFAAHLETHLVAPSTRIALTSHPGCLTYHRPTGTGWSQ